MPEHSVSDIEYIGRRKLADTEEEGPDFPYVRSPLYGEIPAPNTVGELLTYVDHVSGDYAGLAGWRGQAEIDWPLHSTAARRLLGQKTSWPEDTTEWEPLEKLTQNYERRLLEQAKMAGHGFRHGRELTNLELLSVLQHYGAATRLIDFSRNAFVAFWFACRDKPESWGLLMGIEGNRRRIWTNDQLGASIPELIADLRTNNDDYYLWEPRHLFERMRVQQEIFVFGAVEELPWGSAPVSLSLDAPYDRGGSEGLVLIGISPDLKTELSVGSFKGLFGFDARSLFPDIEGFSAFHATNQGFGSLFLDR